MNVPAELISAPLAWTANLGAVAVTVSAVRRAAWHHLSDEGDRNVLLVTSALVLVLWQMSASVYPGQAFHLLGVPLLVLMFGAPFALLVGVLLVAVTVAVEGLGAAAFGVNYLAMVALPAGMTVAVSRLVIGIAPNNFFVYEFAVAFFGSAAALMLTGTAIAAAIAVGGSFGFSHLAAYYLPYIGILAFSEAFVTGGAVAVLGMFAPQWLRAARHWPWE